MTRLNFLFLFTDDQRFDTIGALGNEQILTPNLDELVSSGTTFTRAHIPGGTCGAVCMPSRAMLHTGRTLFHLDREGQDIPEAHTTLGECFREKGYDTFGTGKWHNGREAFARSFSCGDEIFFGGMDDHWNVPAYHFDASGQYASKFPVVKEPFHSNKVEWRHCDHVAPGTHSTDLFADAAIRFLEGRENENPFLMYVSLMAPHDPRTMPQSFLDQYEADNIPVPENFEFEHSFDTGALGIRDELLAAFPRSPEEIRRHIAEYYAMITHLDNALGRLIACLSEQELLEDTVIVFAGDNGLALGQHGLMGKQNVYEHSIRVPLILSGPRIPVGERRNSLVYLMDVLPTLCDLADVPIPESVEGRSLKGCLAREEEVHRALYLAYANSIRGLTDGRHKLIEYACGVTQLFDLQEDPMERVNLCAHDSSVDVIQNLRGQLFDFRDSWDDLTHPVGKSFWDSRSDLIPMA